jgi:hypothetical protein
MGGLLMSTLVNIQPLSQSRYEMMKCPASFVWQESYGAEAPDNPFSALGTELHAVLQPWVWKLHELGPVDLEAWKASQLKLVSQEAAEILEPFWENFCFPAGKVIATEKHLTTDDGSLEGTLDCVIHQYKGNFLIPDWKSSHQILRADTFQSALYPYLLFLHRPDAEVVTFAHYHLRYGGCAREVTWTRAEIPAMEARIERARNRQLELLANPLAFEKQAIPSSRCTYCPLLRTGECPAEEWNPAAKMTLEDRTAWQIYLKQAAKANDLYLKEACIDRDVIIPDGEGKPIRAGFVLRETEQYPMGPTLALLNEWREETISDKLPNGDDLIADLHISRSALKAKLKAKKRVILHQALQDISEKTQSTQFKIAADGAEEDEV